MPMIRKEILPAVAAIIFNEKGDILLQRRMDTKKWCVISGHVEFGETVQEAIVREIQEEAYTRSEVVRLIGVYSSPEYTTYYYPDRAVQYVVTYFEVKLIDQIQEGISNSESAAFSYFPLHRLPEELDLMNPHWLKDALDTESKVFIR
jgi:8-oxo-dGTP diphosphatase